MNLLRNILFEIWSVTVEMAPFLLFGFFMAGILSVVISKEYVKKHLGGRGLLSSVKAALFGVPMPICSCGVIPLAASIRKHGAGRGATASFLASTPQTGIDSLMVTYALLGWIFAVFRALAAFLSGIICGLAVESISSDEAPVVENKTDAPVVKKENLFAKAIKYGFLTLPRNIAKPMTVGIIISGLISGLIPSDFFVDTLGDSPWSMLAMLVIGIPIYVCSSASVPIALAFIKAGLSPGAALVFLITGPATNAATLTTLWEIIGKKQLVVFLITLALTALAAGALMNLFSPTLGVLDQVCHQHTELTAKQLLYATLLITVLLKGIIPQKKDK